jgi:RNA polymerase sigma-70 factor (ECF subfamily)
MSAATLQGFFWRWAVFANDFEEVQMSSPQLPPRPQRLPGSSHLLAPRRSITMLERLARLPAFLPNLIMPIERTSNSVTETADAVLVESVRQRDQLAMAAIFDRYSVMVYSVAYRVLNDSARAEDVMQDIFLQVWQKPEVFIEARGSLAGWLMVMARNRSIDAIRRRKPTDAPEDVVLFSSTNLASETERNLMMEKVRSAMRDLPIEQQKSLELAYFEQLSHAEIAERTGDALGTVKTRIRLALIGVRKALAV